MLTLAKFFLKEKSNNIRCIMIICSGVIMKAFLRLKHTLPKFFYFHPILCHCINGLFQLRMVTLSAD